jgi:nicotinate-nucleotide pyrophosphorylase (carboxylating)
VDAVAQAWGALPDSPEKRAFERPRITATRKTLPGYRDLALEGVLAGGGMSHRYHLAGGLLLKENHMALVGGVEPAVRLARAHAPHVFRVECEVRNSEELAQALRAGAEVVMLDNFSSEEVSRALQQIRDYCRAETRSALPWVEVSGGLSEKNISRYVQPGVSLFSSGSLTHSVDAVDLSLLVD